MRPWPSDRVALGGDYNPEQWPREVWPQDVDLMQQAGVTFVSLGIFSWSALEPAPGQFEPGWLDEIMGLLQDGGIAVDLATATASPAPWFAERYPDELPMTVDGTRLWPGGRQAYCPSSAAFRDATVALVEQMAARYHEHPALAMWHVSNEYACHNAPCYCDRCAAAFRTWLQQRYGDVAAMNDAWGTFFWSQRYTSFDQVLPPRLAPTTTNPTQVLDYRRFTSDAVLALFLAEREVLDKLSPGVPVTTNFMTLDHFRHLDYFSWAPHQDVISTDHYVVDTQTDREAELAFSGDLTRGLAGGEPWLLMEHSTGAVNWQPVNPAKTAGQLLRNSLAHVAHGADTLGFFQWRAAKAGAEKFHSSLLPHAGTHSRLWRDVVRLGEVCTRMTDVVGTRVEADVAILWDYEAAWACDQPSHPSSLLGYGDDAHAIHAALLRRGVTSDVVHPSADLSGYGVVVVPTLYLMTDAAAAAVAAAAEAGAQVLVTFFSGIVDESDHIWLGGYPGALRELLGVRSEEFWPLRAGESVLLDDGSTGTVWTELLELAGAEAVASYADGELVGVPAVTRHDVGTGAAWYLATRLDDASLGSLLQRLLDAAGVRAPYEAPADVELVRRSGEGRSFLFAINHGSIDADVPVTGHDLVADAPTGGTLHLAPGGVGVVREDR